MRKSSISGNPALRGRTPSSDPDGSPSSLPDSSALLSHSFEFHPDSQLIFTPMGGLIHWNRAAEKKFSLPRTNPVHFSDFLLQSETISDRLPDLLREEGKKGGLEIILPVKLKNGESCPAEIRTTLFDFRNETFRLMVIRLQPECDSHETAADQEELRNTSGIIPSLIEEPEMIFEIDPAGVFTSANTPCFEKTGYSKADLRKGIRFLDLLPPEERERGWKDFNRLLSCDLLDTLEYSILRKDGTSFPVIISLSRIVKDSVTLGIRGVALDISEHKRIEENLLVREKLNILGELTGGVVHNFNNILSVILGHLTLFPTEGLDAHRIEIIEKIRRAARDGEDIVKRLTNPSRPMEIPDAVSTDIHAVICDVLEFLKPHLSSPEKTIAVKTSFGLIPPVVIVPFEMREVLSNVVINALDAMPSGGTLSIMTSMADGRVAIAVADTGVGMSEEVKERVFEPFFTTKKDHGTGIGLSVSSAIVDKFSGEIRLESTVGTGTTVTILLPPSVPTPSHPKPAAEPPVRLAHPVRVLVIDDEVNICEILEEYLAREGHRVVTASSGEAGVRALEREPFDIVITDFNMPGISGREIANRVKRLYPNTLIIMLTGWGTSLDDLNRNETIVDHLIFKPINFKELTSVIAGAYGP